MGVLRKIATKNTEGAKAEDAVDVEAQNKSPRSEGSKNPDKKHNPLSLAKAIGSKVYNLITVKKPEEGRGWTGGGHTILIGRTIFFIRDVVLGFIVGVVMISVLILLDHRNVIHSESAHGYRQAAFQLLKDPETIANLEESSNLKYFTMEKYQAKRKQINDAINDASKELKELELTLAGKVAEGDYEAKRLLDMKTEHEVLLSWPTLELEKFNGAGMWDNKVTCEQRFQEIFRVTKMFGLSKLSTMHENPACMKQ